ncbi:hypothetical protein EDB80DRAFT_18821 [Ilyonectria destructans]|nr:hypothetical protein EDB80DRAFT_18821 [Ilyonectria destructans]
MGAGGMWALAQTRTSCCLLSSSAHPTARSDPPICVPVPTPTPGGAKRCARSRGSENTPAVVIRDFQFPSCDHLTRTRSSPHNEVINHLGIIARSAVSFFFPSYSPDCHYIFSVGRISIVPDCLPVLGCRLFPHDIRHPPCAETQATRHTTPPRRLPHSLDCRLLHLLVRPTALWPTF